MDGTVLHILNGDYALELWQKCSFDGQSLVWRETYVEGPLPDTDDLDLFREARAEYLSHFEELVGIDKSRLSRHLLNMDEAVLLLPENATLMLWFDSCMFDQTILMRILHLVNRKNTGTGNVFLYCCEGNCLTIEDFRQGWLKKVQLQPHDWAVAGEAWNLFIRKDADGIRCLLELEPFERLSKMKKALLRCIDEFPDRNGLTRTQRQILKLVADGCHGFMEIFKGLDDFEEYPFLGDTACQRLLDQLVRNGFLIRSGDRYDLP